MQAFEAELADNDLLSDPLAKTVQMISEVNRYFHLGETLRETCRRRWWDILAFRLAIEIDKQTFERAQAPKFGDERTEMTLVHDAPEPPGWN